VREGWEDRVLGLILRAAKKNGLHVEEINGENACPGEALGPATVAETWFTSSSSHGRAFTCSPAAMRKAPSALLRTIIAIFVVGAKRQKEEVAAGKWKNAQVWGRRRRRR